MVHLTLAGLSEDGKRLLLVSDAGVEFTLDADTKLRAALRGDSHAMARLGQLEIKMESVLRPRDIQARIRAGESPEAVAAAAQTSVDKIMPYAAPVMAEREHVAQRAQRASLRRSAGAASAASRTLGDAIGSHLRGQNVDPGGVGLGRLAPRGRPLDPDRHVPGQRPRGPGGLHVRRPRQLRLGRRRGRPLAGRRRPGRGRRRSRPGREHRRPVGGPATPTGRRTSRRAAARRGRHRPGHRGARRARVPRLLGVRGPRGGLPRRRARVELDDTEPEHRGRTNRSRTSARTDSRADEPAGRPAKRKGRASVPSWDEIMFGGGKHD